MFSSHILYNFLPYYSLEIVWCNKVIIICQSSATVIISIHPGSTKDDTLLHWLHEMQYTLPLPCSEQHCNVRWSERAGCEGLGKLFHGLGRSVISDMCKNVCIASLYIQNMAKRTCGQYQGPMPPIASLHPIQRILNCRRYVIISYPESWSKKHPWIGRSLSTEIIPWRYILWHKLVIKHIGNETTWWCLMILIYSCRICSTWWRQPSITFAHTCHPECWTSIASTYGSAQGDPICQALELKLSWGRGSMLRGHYGWPAHMKIRLKAIH